MRRGFTLIEVLVALALVSVLTLSLCGTLETGFRAERRARAALEPVTTVQAALAAVRADVESMLPPNGVLAGNFLGENGSGADGRASDFLEFYTASGSPDIERSSEAAIGKFELEAFTLSPTTRAVGCDIIKIELGLLESTRTGQGYDLVRWVTRNSLTPTEETPEPCILCRDVLAFNVTYLDGSEWIDEWDSSQRDNQIPPALRIELVKRVREPRSGGEEREVVDDALVSAFKGEMVLTVPCAGTSTEEGNQFIR